MYAIKKESKISVISFNLIKLSKSTSTTTQAQYINSSQTQLLCIEPVAGYLCKPNIFQNVHVYIIIFLFDTFTQCYFCYVLHNVMNKIIYIDYTHACSIYY